MRTRRENATTERDPAAIGKRLLQVRTILGLNQIEVARSARIGQSTYSAYELGLRQCSITAAHGICDAYDITLDYIFRGDTSGLPLRIANELNRLKR